MSTIPKYAHLVKKVNACSKIYYAQHNDLLRYNWGIVGPVYKRDYQIKAEYSLQLAKDWIDDMDCTWIAEETNHFSWAVLTPALVAHILLGL